LSEDISLDDEEQTSRKPPVRLPTRGQVLQFRSRASTPSAAEPYNLQAGHPSGQARPARRPAPQGPRRDGMGECGLGWGEGTAPLRGAAARRAPQRLIFGRAPSAPQPGCPSAGSIALSGLAVPWAGSWSRSLRFLLFSGCISVALECQIAHFTSLIFTRRSW